MTELILVRHGQSIANLERWFAGHTNAELSELGRKQAACVGRYVTQHYKIDAIYSSDLSRAYHTALPTAQKLNLPVHTDPALRELYAGKWEKMNYERLVEEFPHDFGEVWRYDFSNARCTGGESIAELYDRVCPALLRIAEKHDGQTVLVASHATPIRTFAAMALGYDRMHVGEVNILLNASISRFAVENGVPRVLELNLTEHLNAIDANSDTIW